MGVWAEFYQRAEYPRMGFGQGFSRAQNMGGWGLWQGFTQEQYMQDGGWSTVLLESRIRHDGGIGQRSDREQNMAGWGVWAEVYREEEYGRIGIWASTKICRILSRRDKVLSWFLSQPQPPPPPTPSVLGDPNSGNSGHAVGNNKS